ncbi:hypothetical protein [Kitasatospora sp. NPDC059599]|uniref:hypothetical protein n=1 Tax=Kitasatospora sp. NPDC059599 TaxID=3346880 RepID=UPI0036A53BF2
MDTRGQHRTVPAAALPALDPQHCRIAADQDADSRSGILPRSGPSADRTPPTA